MVKKLDKVCWVTPDYFVDCDIDIVGKLSQYYSIDWAVIIPSKDARFKEADFDHLKKFDNLHITFFYLNYRARNLKNILFYFGLSNWIRKRRAAVNYINHVPTLFFTFVFTLFLGSRNTILTAHQGAVHTGFKYQFAFKLIFNIAYSVFTNNHLFSFSQQNVFLSKHKKNRTFLIPLALKSFGGSSLTKRIDKTVFFNFGTIRTGKNIEMFIEAACNLYSRGRTDFEVVLAGSCNDWDHFQARMRFPEIFSCDIRTIDNSEISNLFAANHFLVLPYSIVTQSGPLKIAFNYSVPVIASNEPGFKDEITDEKNGFLFITNDVRDLERVMIKAMDVRVNCYSQLQDSLDKIVEQRFSDDIIINSYRNMFSQVTTSRK